MCVNLMFLLFNVLIIWLVNGNWGSWSSYGECFKKRTRACDSPKPSYGGLTCRGSSSETSACSPTTAPGWQKYLSYEYNSMLNFVVQESFISIYWIILIIDCLDAGWCSVIINGTESVICTKRKAQNDCPVTCKSFLPEDHPCSMDPGMRCRIILNLFTMF